VVHEGSADAPATTNTTSDSRTNGADTDQNGADFTGGAPSPTDSGTKTPGAVRIHDIQGAGWVSPYNGESVANVPGIVTAVRTGGSKGYWIQDPNPDADPATSEGLFVDTGYGKADLTLSPGRIDPGNPVWTSSRKPLVGEFAFGSKTVFVIANHFVAKLGDQNADGRDQYPAQSSQIQRAGQAQVEHDFVQKLLAVDKNADVVVLGDLNDYQFSSPVNALKTGTADGTGPSILTDLITTLPPDQQYTYDYQGISEVLDHILVTRNIDAYTYQVVHVNSEFANQTSDHDPQQVQFKP
jgi:predicted extracellular nuclease